ncbi:MAG: hypothetical protein Q9191_002587 [Dirinaria sp. TL-2023a]
MKRKFSLSSLRLKAPTQVEPSRESPPSESPPYSPTLSECERPRVPLNVLLELKQSCAVLVNDTNPPTDEYDDVPDPREALRKYEEQQAAKKRAQAKAEARAAAKAGKAEQEASLSRRPREEKREPSRRPAPYKHVPTNAATSFGRTAVPRRPSQSQALRPESADLEPIEPYHTKTSAKSRATEEEEDAQLYQIRAALESRPKTSAAACIDYSGPSNQTSASTSRSQTTDYSQRMSTGVTSINTPGDDKRSSFTNQNQRVSEQILQDGASASLADATAKAWMMQELARRRAEHKSGPARPASRASVKPVADPSRAPSRAGSIAGSVIDGVRDYIRPRGSMDSMRSTRSDTDLSRSHSRSSSIKGRDSNGGWRAQLRRKGSFSSWRNAKPQHEESRSPDPGVVNLNRELPALPGLDQYKEKKPKPAHISQIMRPPRQKKTKDASANQYAPPPVVQPLSAAEEQRRRYEIQRAVEEKMRMTSTMAAPGPGHRPMTVAPHVSTHPALKGPSFPGHQPRSHSQPVVRTVQAPSVTVLEVPKTPGPADKKSSLRKRLSRFWSAGGSKDGSSAPGKMVAAN